MGIEIGRDDLLTLAQAAELFPRDKSGEPVTPNAVWRWVQPGRKPRLDAIRVGSRWYTTLAALQAFARACSGEEQPQLATRRERSRSYREAEARLDAAGVK